MLGEAEILAEEGVAHSHSILTQVSIEEQSPVAYESSPLLAKAIDGGAVTENNIQKEWENISWWWRPSVCISLTCRGITT